MTVTKIVCPKCHGDLTTEILLFDNKHLQERINDHREMMTLLEDMQTHLDKHEAREKELAALRELVGRKDEYFEKIKTLLYVESFGSPKQWRAQATIDQIEIHGVVDKALALDATPEVRT